MSAIRNEVINCIEDLPDNRLEALMPILLMLRDDTITIETDLTDEEKNIVHQGRNEYKQGGFTTMALN